MISKAQLLKKFKKMGENLNEKLGDVQSRGEKNLLIGLQKGLEDIENQILLVVKGLAVEDGKIENSPRNLDQIIARRKGIERIIEGIILSGTKAFVTSSLEAENVNRKEFNAWVKELQKMGLSAEFALTDKPYIQEVTRAAIKIYGDSTREISDVIQQGLIRMSLGGATPEQLINEMTAKIPAIDKVRVDGGRYRLSADARARFIYRTETTKINAKVMDKLSKQAFGGNYLVQNFNPMDNRTDQVLCAPATEAGPIKINELIGRFGLPGRHPNCRCSIGSLPDFIV